MWKKWHPIKPLTNSVRKLWQFCCVDVYRSESLILPIVVLHRLPIIKDTGLSHYKLRVKYAKCQFSQDDNNVIESSDPSCLFCQDVPFFTFQVSTHIHFSISQINSYRTPTFLYVSRAYLLFILRQCCLLLESYEASVSSVMDFL